MPEELEPEEKFPVWIRSSQFPACPCLYAEFLLQFVGDYAAEHRWNERVNAHEQESRRDLEHLPSRTKHAGRVQRTELQRMFVVKPESTVQEKGRDYPQPVGSRTRSALGQFLGKERK